jgi:predicted enzyme related to lactoylglutathione lyase
MAGHGTFYWNELMTRDTKKARDFYGTMLGWTFDAMPMPNGMTYYVAKQGDKPAGGIFEMTGADFAGVPTHWFSYIEVDDVDRRVAAATKAGAKLHRPIFDIAGVGRIAIIEDPVGAHVGWMTPA